VAFLLTLLLENMLKIQTLLYLVVNFKILSIMDVVGILFLRHNFVGRLSFEEKIGM